MKKVFETCFTFVFHHKIKIMYDKIKAIIMSFDPLQDDPMPFVITRAEVDDMAEQITALLYSVETSAHTEAPVNN